MPLTNVIFELPIQFDVLDAAVYEFLPGYVNGWVEFERQSVTYGSVVYHLSQKELGDLGKVKVRKKADHLSDLSIGHPPRPTDQEILHYERLITPGVQEEIVQLKDSMRNNPKYILRTIITRRLTGIKDLPIEIIQRENSSHLSIVVDWPNEYSEEMRLENILAVSREISYLQKNLHEKKKDHLGKVADVLFDRLVKDRILLDLNSIRSHLPIEVHSNKIIPEVDWPELRIILMKHHVFRNNDTLKDVFSDPRLIIWRSQLPQRDNDLDRVNAVIAYLSDKANRNNEKALILLLKVLMEMTDISDRYYLEIDALITKFDIS